MKKKKGIKVPEFTVTQHVGFFDVYFRTISRVHNELYHLISLSEDKEYSDLPANRTVGCNCHLCTTMKYIGRDSDNDYEVYLSNYQPDNGYRAVARFKKMHPNFIERTLREKFQRDEFTMKRIQYVLDFKSKRPEDLLELITESIKIDHDSTKNIHVYVENCKINGSKGSIIRLNIVVNYPICMTGIGIFIDKNPFGEIKINSYIKFCTFDQDAFFRALTDQCMAITESQMESLKKQLQDTANMNDLWKIASRYVDSRCVKFHPLQSLLERGLSGSKRGNNPPSFDDKKVVFNTEPDIIPELEYYLPEFK